MRKPLSSSEYHEAFHLANTQLGKSFRVDIWNGRRKYIERDLKRNPSLAALPIGYGETLLHKAVGLNDEWLVEQLLIAGADPYKASDFGSTPTDLAKTSGKIGIVRLLESVPNMTT